LFFGRISKRGEKRRKLGFAFGVTAAGNGVCLRIRYQSGKDTVDEEFYGFMSEVVSIPYTGPQGTTYEYHRYLSLVHSMGAKNKTLESMRPVLGLVASSFQTDKIWLQHYQAVIKQWNYAYQQNLALGYAQIEAAGQLSHAISANNDAMIQAMDQQRAQANTASARADDRAYKAIDNYDQYIRGTEKVEDAYGQVSEQPNQYNYQLGRWLWQLRPHQRSRLRSKPLHHRRCLSADDSGEVSLVSLAPKPFSRTKRTASGRRRRCRRAGTPPRPGVARGALHLVREASAPPGLPAVRCRRGVSPCFSCDLCLSAASHECSVRLWPDGSQRRGGAGAG